MVDISKIAAASFMPGLQNVGQLSGQALISGNLEASPGYNTNTSNMTGTIFVSLPDPTVVSAMRVNLPSANGQLASRWFPLFGTAILTDSIAGWDMVLYVGSATGGRNIYFNFVNHNNSLTTFTNYPINIYAHLYSYAW